MSYQEKDIQRLLDQITSYDEVLLGAVEDCFAQLETELIEQYDKKTVSKDKAVDTIAQQFQMLYQAFLRLESTKMKHDAAAGGYDTLTTDTQGARSAAWFESSRKAFATGIARSCVGCAIINPDSGMAAAHRNTVSLSDLKKFLARYLDLQPNRRAELFRQLTEDFSASCKILVTPSSLTNTVATTIHQAFDEFVTIAPNGIPRYGTTMFIFGIDYLSNDKFPLIKATAQRIVQGRGSGNGQMVGVRKEIGISFDGLGQSAGIIYGGKNHSDPTLRKPQFYQFS